MNYDGRLSALQKEILLAIANNTINISECRDAEEHIGVYADGHSSWSHDFWHEGRAKYSEVFESVCESYWDMPHVNQGIYHRKEVQPKRVSFSRSIHNLVKEKKLVSALALAWIVFESDPHGNYYEDLWSWQGGGRGKDDKFGGTNDTPRYKLLGLIERGWSVVRGLYGETIGMCPHLKEEIFVKEMDDVAEWWESKRKMEDDSSE